MKCETTGRASVTWLAMTTPFGWRRAATGWGNREGREMTRNKEMRAEIEKEIWVHAIRSTCRIIVVATSVWRNYGLNPCDSMTSRSWLK